MSGKDEADFVQINNNDSVLKTEQSVKANADDKYEQINGNSETENGNNSNQQLNSTNSSGEKSTISVSESTSKPTTPSNWVQFENDDEKVTICYCYKFEF